MIKNVDANNKSGLTLVPTEAPSITDVNTSATSLITVLSVTTSIEDASLAKPEAAPKNSRKNDNSLHLQRKLPIESQTTIQRQAFFNFVLLVLYEWSKKRNHPKNVFDGGLELTNVIESEKDIPPDAGYGGLSLEEDKRWNWGCQK